MQKRKYFKNEVKILKCDCINNISGFLFTAVHFPFTVSHEAARLQKLCVCVCVCNNLSSCIFDVFALFSPTLSPDILFCSSCKISTHPSCILCLSLFFLVSFHDTHGILSNLLSSCEVIREGIHFLGTEKDAFLSKKNGITFPI